MATSLEPHWPGDAFPLTAITVRKSRIADKGRVSHLFTDYINGAVSGFAVAFCGLVQRPNTKNAYNKWEDAPDGTPLCNNCGREFHKRRKRWVGQP